MIYTFYSFKGGVGRSMAMANVAEWFYQQGLRVVIIDWDLEAPGLENFFYKTEDGIEAVRSQLGLIDMLMAYKRIFPRLRIPEAEPAPVTKSKTSEPKSVPDAGPNDWAQLLRDNLPPITDALYPIRVQNTSVGKGGELKLLPAGWRSGDRFPAYAQAVQSFDWTEFYAAYEGESYFNWMREQLLQPQVADVVLIDSRTGVTEMGGVCTRQLADIVVSFCVPNSGNLTGVQMMAKSFTRQEIVEKRQRPLEVVVVPSRIDISEVNDRLEFETTFRATLDQFTPLAFKSVDGAFWDLQIQYVPKFAYREGLAIGDPRVPELDKAYKKLAAHLALLAQGTSGERVRVKFADELQREFAGHLPSLYQLTDQDRDRYLQLSFFPEDSPIALADAQQLWGLDATATAALTERLAGISLIKYEPDQNIIRVNRIVREKLLEQMPDHKALNQKIEAAFTRLSWLDQESARPILTRLVRLVAPDEDGRDTGQRVKIGDVDESAQAVIRKLADAELVTIDKEKVTGALSFQLANEAYVNGWNRLSDWIREDREFLLWRQQLRSKISEWETTKRDQGALLSGAPLDVAVNWRNQRRDELNKAENLYIGESVREAERLTREAERIKHEALERIMLAEQQKIAALKTRRSRRIVIAASVLLLMAVVGLATWQRLEQKKEQAAQATRLAESYNNLGSLEMTNRNYDAAYKAFSKAIETKPDYADPYLNRARIRLEQNQIETPQQAVADYTQVTKLKPDLAAAYFERGDIYSGSSNTAELALADYNDAIKLKSDYWNAYLNRGNLYENLKAFNSAIADYTRVIDSNSDEFKALAYLRRGSTYAKTGDKEKATNDLVKATSISRKKEILDEANTELRSIGYQAQPETQVPARVKVFLQYSDRRDGPFIDALAITLEHSNFDVQGKELREENVTSEVRYYSTSPQIVTAAKALMDIVVKSIVAQSKTNFEMRISYFGKAYPYVARENIEVWIPSLQASTPAMFK
jgi:tetratricopeptide (TPR) repeat protein